MRAATASNAEHADKRVPLELILRHEALDRPQAAEWRLAMRNSYAGAVSAAGDDRSRQRALRAREIDFALLHSVTGVTRVLDQYREGAVTAVRLTELLAWSRRSLKDIISVLRSDEDVQRAKIIRIVRARVAWLSGQVDGHYYRAKQAMDLETLYESGADLQSVIRQQRIALSHLRDLFALATEGRRWSRVLKPTARREWSNDDGDAKRHFESIIKTAPQWEKR